MPFESAASFYDGVLDPLLVPAHALAIVGAGLLAGAARRSWPAAALYVAGLTLGFAAMIAGLAPVLVLEILLALTAANGTWVALARPRFELSACMLAFCIGVALALDSPPSVISLTQANVIVAGTFCGATVGFLAIAGSTTILHRAWQRIGVRILGSWVAASAVMALALRLAR